MRRLVFVLALLAPAAAGCGSGSPALNTAPITDEERREIEARDKAVDEAERGGSGTAVPRKK